MLQKSLKPLLKATLFTIAAAALLYALAALFLLKKQSSSQSYFYAAVAIHLVLGALITVLFRKEDYSFIYLFPLLLLQLLLPIVFHSFELKFLLLPASVAAVHFLIRFIIKHKKSSKKRNMHQIRRKYERLHKK